MPEKADRYQETGTQYIKEEVSRCESIQELKETVFPRLRSQEEAWSGKIKEIIGECGYSKTKFAALCGVSRVAVDNWCKGAIPKNRETFLRIGLAAGYSTERMNHLLQRYGHYPALYSKSLEDCVCLYVINHGYGEETAVKYGYILDRIKANIAGEDSIEEVKDVTTEKFDEKVAEVQGEDELEQFIADNIAMFSNAYHKFYAYVKMNISVNYLKPAFAGSVFEIAEVQGWSSSLRQCVSAIRQNKWYPTRNKVISLGLHLSMDHEQIDEMLQLAHMEPLCAKNVFESVIMFILDDASLNDIMNTDSEDYDPDELCSYAREILKELDIPGITDFISELPEVEDDW
ncbi:MAG: hypothetical protein IJ600_05845 [Lachnospiraceae bacterium]|nr:hypothetical protein [Lachnospiraceae bacterium]